MDFSNEHVSAKAYHKNGFCKELQKKINKN